VQLPPPTPRPREGSGRLAAARTAAAAAGNPSTQPQLPLPDGGTHPHLPVPSWKTPGQALGQLGKGQDYAQTPQHSTHGHFLGGGKRPGLPSHARGPQHPTAEAPPHRSPPGSGGARSRSLSFSGGRWRCAVTQRSPTPSLPRADPDPASAPPATASSTRTICWSHMRGAGRQRTTGGDRGPQGELPVKMTSTGTEEGRGAHFQQDLQPRLSHPSPPPHSTLVPIRLSTRLSILGPSPGHTFCGTRLFPSGRAASTAGCTAPSARCWARLSCWPSALRSTGSSYSCNPPRDPASGTTCPAHVPSEELAGC